MIRRRYAPQDRCLVCFSKCWIQSTPFSFVYVNFTQAQRIRGCRIKGRGKKNRRVGVGASIYMKAIFIFASSRTFTLKWKQLLRIPHREQGASRNASVPAQWPLDQVTTVILSARESEQIDQAYGNFDNRAWDSGWVVFLHIEWTGKQCRDWRE